MKEVLITDEMAWPDIVEALCKNLDEVTELIVTAQAVQDRYYAEEQETFMNRHQPSLNLEEAEEE